GRPQYRRHPVRLRSRRATRDRNGPHATEMGPTRPRRGTRDRDGAHAIVTGHARVGELPKVRSEIGLREADLNCSRRPPAERIPPGRPGELPHHGGRIPRESSDRRTRGRLTTPSPRIRGTWTALLLRSPDRPGPRACLPGPATETPELAMCCRSKRRPGRDLTGDDDGRPREVPPTVAPPGDATRLTASGSPAPGASRRSSR